MALVLVDKKKTKKNGRIFFDILIVIIVFHLLISFSVINITSNFSTHKKSHLNSCI